MGRELAGLYVLHGARVAVTAPTLAELSDAVAELRAIRAQARAHRGSKGPDIWSAPDDAAVMPLAYDALKDGDGARVVREAVEGFGRGGGEAEAGLDGVVLNHIVSVYYRALEVDVDRAMRDLERVTKANYVSYVEVALRALPHLREAGKKRARKAMEGGRGSPDTEWVRSQLVAISSLSAKVLNPCTYAYGGSKAGVSNTFALLHLELANHPGYKDYVSQTTMHFAAVRTQGFLSVQSRFPVLPSRSSASDPRDAAWATLKGGCSGRLEVLFPSSIGMTAPLYAMGGVPRRVVLEGVAWAHGGWEGSFGPPKGVDDGVGADDARQGSVGSSSDGQPREHKSETTIVHA
ncbi:hypothetical protein M427DRAFT_62898 [Gonapodya prolifera JEL478]|uniref:NAD(P)-binding protein n=1 Tax=Gonapodya prolifera (strain JEL478) TaxID=1344416 RepID=A0A139A1C9_GONPJ|nr:hypothetical protein M427DRAFT_62898 [Gonapodya prolifera JEL478]|eukprot:KXS10163.1 hypothetical protein M427DRAFT_62898 [Gonapodya prolifera JEL478]